MTPELLASIVAVVLSLAASYLPGFSDWYAALAPSYKRLLMLGLLALTALGSLVVACAGFARPAGLSLACDEAGALALFKSFLAALVANQAAYSITKRSSSASLALPASNAGGGARG
jgi:hypothetical protein